ncbi:MAG: nitrogen fixation protein NifQ [Oceanobacter sp.]
MNLAASIKQVWYWPMSTFEAGMQLGSTQRERTEQQQHNRQWLCQMISSQRLGKTCLPYHVGLHPVDFNWLMEHQLNRCAQPHKHISPSSVDHGQARNQEDLRQQLLEMREDEWVEIRDLLRRHRRGLDDLELVVSDVLAAGCLGKEHLWRDLGLNNRTELSQMISANFPELAEKNDKNMKWKKFFYKQLCEEGGGYVCRAPSCQECATYSDCFGPEE